MCSSQSPTFARLYWTVIGTVLTPHIGSATVETRKRMAEMVLLDLDAFFSGAEPQNVVTRDASSG